MNPRVSRSSSLASKATGFPIAKIAAMAAVGLTLDEITNDITGQTKAAFEPALDYLVVKIPRWAFEKFPGVDPELGPQMKSVGEVMALGHTFPEALNKANQSLEIGVDGPEAPAPTARRPQKCPQKKSCAARGRAPVQGYTGRCAPASHLTSFTALTVTTCGSWRRFSK